MTDTIEKDIVKHMSFTMVLIIKENCYCSMGWDCHSIELVTQLEAGLILETLEVSFISLFMVGAFMGLIQEGQTPSS